MVWNSHAVIHIGNLLDLFDKPKEEKGKRKVSDIKDKEQKVCIYSLLQKLFMDEIKLVHINDQNIPRKW